MDTTSRIMMGVARRAKWLSHRLLRSPVILAYHRVAELPRDPLLLAVRPDHFREQLEVIRRLAVPMTLPALVQGVPGGHRVRGGVAITFDDGYLDNLTEARPLLEEAETGATVFVTTAVTGRLFWWDELERLVLAPARLPPTFRLPVDGVTREWTLEEEPSTSEGNNSRWNAREAARSPRHRLYLELHALFRPLAPELRDDALAELARWSVYAPEPSTGDRSLTEGEIVELAADGLVAVGAHTERHPVLAALPLASQRSEIEGSRRYLCDLLGQPPASFAYPYGSPTDYNAVTLGILREAGFSWACTTVPGVVGRRTAPLELPRFLVRDWNGEEFERRFLSFFRG